MVSLCLCGSIFDCQEMGILEVYVNGGGPPAEDLAFERWMLERAAGGVCCAFMYSWEGPVVVLGYAQDASDVDLEWCRRHRVPVLRRLTGGTGVVHQSDLALSVALPATHPWAKGVIGLYGWFLDQLEPALRSAGGNVRRIRNPARASRVRSPICFEDQLSDTLLANGRKAVGCAQTRRGGAVLVHAAILLGLDPSLYASVFRVDAERIRRNLTSAVPDGDWRDVGRIVVNSVAAGLELSPDCRDRPAIPRSHLEPYLQERWSPVSAGGDLTK